MNLLITNGIATATNSVVGYEGPDDEGFFIYHLTKDVDGEPETISIPVGPKMGHNSYMKVIDHVVKSAKENEAEVEARKHKKPEPKPEPKSVPAPTVEPKPDVLELNSTLA